MAEQFFNDLFDENDSFLKTLCARTASESIHFEKDAEGKKILSYKFPGNATGLNLLKVFVAMVTHTEFTEENSWKNTGKGAALEFEFAFSSSDHVMSITCGATPKQPGNCSVNNYGSHSKYHYLDLDKLASNFRDFLTFPLSPPTDKQVQDYSDTDADEWKVSVLLLFEIARRITEDSDHPHYNMPVAAGIQMAMEISGQLTTAQFFDLFRKSPDERQYALKEIAEKYYEMKTQERKEMTVETAIILEMNIIESFHEMMKIYEDPQDLSGAMSDLAIDETQMAPSPGQIGVLPPYSPYPSF